MSVLSSGKYEIPLRTLMDTMKSSGFQNWTDVIVVIGGAEDNRIYQKGDLTYMETKRLGAQQGTIVASPCSPLPHT